MQYNMQPRIILRKLNPGSVVCVCRYVKADSTQKSKGDEEAESMSEDEDVDGVPLDGAALRKRSKLESKEV